MILQKARVYLVRKTHRFLHPREKANIRTQDIHVAFNYGQPTGSAQLLRFITEHTEVTKSQAIFWVAAHNIIRSYTTLLTRIGNAA